MQLVARPGGPIFNPSILEAKADRSEFEGSLVYTERPYFKKQHTHKRNKNATCLVFLCAKCVPLSYPTLARTASELCVV